MTVTANWSIAKPLPVSRADGSSAIIYGKLYIFGGYASTKRVRKDTFMFDPAMNTWTRCCEMPVEHTFASAACAIGSRAYVFGGFDDDHYVSGDLCIYDAFTDKWTVKKKPCPVLIHSASAIAVNRKIFLVGGAQELETSGNVIVYDTMTDRYDLTRAPMLTPRRFFSLSAVDGVLYAIGGGHDKARNLDVNEAYRVDTNKWTTKAPLPYPRWGLARENAAMSDGHILISHGIEYEQKDKLMQKFQRTACVYCSHIDRWFQLPSAYHERDGHNCGVINGRFYAVGGRDAESAVKFNEVFG